MSKTQIIALTYIFVLIAGIYGYAVGRFKVFPYHQLEPVVKELSDYVAGDPMERETSVMQKLKSDFGFSFDRMLYNYPEKAIAGARAVNHPDLAERKEPPLVFVAPEHQAGYRVVVGLMHLTDALWGALLLDQTGEVIHTWPLSTEHLPTNQAKDRLKILYGVNVFEDGSVIFVMHEKGGGIVKVDACGEVVWNLEGSYHHAIVPDEDGTFWTFVGGQHTFDQDIASVSIETGEIVRTIHMADVRDANPRLPIWDLQSNLFEFYTKRDKYKVGNMTHGNDVDPLPTSLAADFPDFNPGDLVISYATTNLIFVLDPNSLEVKWYRLGVGDLQHDPDWEPGGIIGLYSNNTRTSRVPDVMGIDPATYEVTVLADGYDLELSAGINSTHQLTDFNTRMITNAQQGWVVEVDAAGDPIFSYVNSVMKDKRKALHMSDAWRFGEDYFETEFWKSCRP